MAGVLSLNFPFASSSFFLALDHHSLPNSPLSSEYYSSSTQSTMAAVATPPTALPMMSPNQAPIMGNPAATQAQPTVPTPTAVRPPLSPTNTSSSTMSGSSPSSPKHEWPDCTGSPTRTASKGIPALETPVYVLPSFVRDEQTIIVLKDSATMFDRRQCDVRDAHGKIILTVKEHLASLVNQKGESLPPS